MLPAAMIRLCPAISRGTDWVVPSMPGLVRLTVVSAKSSGVSWPACALRISSL